MDNPDILTSSTSQRERIDLLYDMGIHIADVMSRIALKDEDSSPPFAVARGDIVSLVTEYLRRLEAYRIRMRMIGNRISYSKVAALTCLLVMERAPIRTVIPGFPDIAPTYHANSNLCYFIACNMLNIEMAQVPKGIRREILYFFTSLSKIHDTSEGNFPYVRRFRFAMLLLMTLEEAFGESEGH